jgi:hypothetical protein
VKGAGFELGGLEQGQHRFQRGLRNGVWRKHLAQQSDDFSICDQRAAARTRKGVSLGQRAQNHKVGPLREMSRECCLGGELNVRLIDHHQRVLRERGRDPQDRIGREEVPGRVIRRAEKNDLDPGRRTFEQRLLIEREALVRTQRHIHHLRSLDARGHGIHTEGGWADEHRVVLCTTKCADQKVDRIIAAACGKDRERRHAVEPRQALDENLRLAFWIAVETCARVIPRHTPGKLVRVQTREVRVPGGSLVGFEREDVRSDQRLHPAHTAIPSDARLAKVSPVFSASSTARRLATALA